MRVVRDAPYGTMDFLFAELMLWAKAQGYRWFGLGWRRCPVCRKHRLAPLWSRLGRFMYRHGAQFYNFQACAPTRTSSVRSGSRPISSVRRGPYRGCLPEVAALIAGGCSASCGNRALRTTSSLWSHPGLPRSGRRPPPSSGHPRRSPSWRRHARWGRRSRPAQSGDRRTRKPSGTRLVASITSLMSRCSDQVRECWCSGSRQNDSIASRIGAYRHQRLQSGAHRGACGSGPRLALRRLPHEPGRSSPMARPSSRKASRDWAGSRRSRFAHSAAGPRAPP